MTSGLPSGSPGRPTQVLLSLPAAAARGVASLLPLRDTPLYVDSDPDGAQLSSGGGTVWLLERAWRAEGAPRHLEDWLGDRLRVVLHGSGESRRLPGYAAGGKPALPLPLVEGVGGQRPDQCLFDFLLPLYEGLARHAPAGSRVLVACGDVLVTAGGPPPRMPEADVLVFGLPARAEEARHHGVLVCERGDPGAIAFFAQKPEADRIRVWERERACLLDTGIWMLSLRALRCLLERCLWDPRAGRFTGPGGLPGRYDLYGTFGPALGREPLQPDAAVSALTCRAVPLPEGKFLHFGTHRALLDSVSQLRSPAQERAAYGGGDAGRRRPILLHADVRTKLEDAHHSLWIENSTIPAGWRLTKRHVLTGIPPNDWTLHLAPDICLDALPLVAGGWCLRVVGFEDGLRGAIGEPSTCWLGGRLGDWLAARALTWRDIGSEATEDLFDAALCPVFGATAELDSAWIEALWRVPKEAESFARVWRAIPRLSFREGLRRVDIDRLSAQRYGHMAAAPNLGIASWPADCERIDLAALSRLCQARGWPLPPSPAGVLQGEPGLTQIHLRMLEATHAAGVSGRPVEDAPVFADLSARVVAALDPVASLPRRATLDDQLVWGRCPVRLDLAGGWTDTPPYCLAYGGQVVNVAVELNGQPPVQVFGRVCREPVLRLRSIDLGRDIVIREFDELDREEELGSGFGIARVALRLAGFGRAGAAADSLRGQLEACLGGGLELSMVCAVPKGSGLGTSSILAVTLLAVLNDVCGLGWTRDDLFLRTLALEQLLRSGGGWQDQVGGALPGAKLLLSAPGLRQRPVARWLPEQPLAHAAADGRLLLYYTGLTRVAHDILGDIVRGFFLNERRVLACVGDIGANALWTADALQRGDWDGLCEGVRRSWRLNCALDAGTCPPAVAAMLSRIADFSEACKLTGAGGGGYLLILAKDAEAGKRVRKALENDPPARGARFVDVGLSPTGLQVTRS